MSVAEVSDGSGLRRLFAKSTLDIDKFVKNVAKSGEQSTDSMVEKLSRMSQDASDKIKRVVFDNYKLFIKAGKAASQLETAMHQIHNEFTEKQRLMNALAELYLFPDSYMGPDATDRILSNTDIDKSSEPSLSKYAGMSVTRLAELIEGTTALVDDSSRIVIFDGELHELNPDNFQLMSTAHLFLLTDCLLVAYPQSTKNSSFNFRLQVTYDLNNFAVVNVPARNRRYAPLNLFKLLVFPVIRLFQTDTPHEKQLWLRLLDETMSSRRKGQFSKNSTDIALEPSFLSTKSTKSDTPSITSSASVQKQFTMRPPQVSRESAVATFNAISCTLPDCVGLLTPVNEISATSRKNPFNDSFQENNNRTPVETSKMPLTTSSDNWLWDVPEDLDVAISERDFTRAIDLVFIVRDRIARVFTEFDQLSSAKSTDVSKVTTSYLEKKVELIGQHTRSEWEKLVKRIERTERNLSEALQYEIMTAANRHGAPNSVRTTVSHLNTLGKGILAAQLFLIYRSQVMGKALTHGVLQEGNQLVYINQLSLTFHRNLAETAAEWRQNVVEILASTCNSRSRSMSKKQMEHLLALRFCSWALDETDKFAQQIRVLLVDSHAISFYSMAHATQRIRAHANKVTDLLGVDISSTLHRGLIKVWQQAAEEQTRVLCEAIEHRAKQESWEPLSALPKPERDKFISDLMEFELLNASNANKFGPNLTMSTYHLARSVRQFAKSVNLLHCDDLSNTMIGYFVRILLTEYKNYEIIVSKQDLTVKTQTIVQLNLDFITHAVLPKCATLMNCTRHPSIRQLISNFEDLCVNQ